MQSTYWPKLSDRRVTRRRMMTGSAAGFGAAAFLAACGGGSSKTSSSGSASKNLFTPVDTSKQATQGGTFKEYRINVNTHNDALLGSSFATVAAWTYSKLFLSKPGLLADSTGEIMSDLAQSYEVSPDNLTLTMKLQPTAKWDQRTPTNSRPVDAQDILFSWNKFITFHNHRSNFANALSPDASIVSVNATDDHTIVMKLARPDAGLITDLASSFFFIEPREADGGFNAKVDVRGSGAWYVEKEEPNVGITFRRNPNWYRQDRPFIDRWEQPDVIEYAARLAQFKAGNVYTADVIPEDLLQTKSEVPALQMMQNPAWRSGIFYWNFGWKQGTMFEDDRIRKAFSMALDRDQVLEVFSNADKFAQQGMEVESRWFSHLPASWSGWWLDPKSSEMGPGAAFFKHDPDEAKKMLSAAGHANGLEIPAVTANHPTYATQQNQYLVMLQEMNDVGIKTNLRVADYTSEFSQKYQLDLNADYDGIATIYQASSASRPTFLRLGFVPGGGGFHGFYSKGNYRQGDPEVTKMVTAIRTEFDDKKQTAMAKDFQKYLANTMYYVPWPGISQTFSLNWPVVGNYNVYRPGDTTASTPQEILINYWIDATKAPLKNG